MRNDKYWKCAVSIAAAALLPVCVRLARRDLMLRKYCKDVELDSFFGELAPPLLIVLAAAYALFALWQWITVRPLARRRVLSVTLAALLAFGALSGGYLRYHREVYEASEKQAKYDKAWEKGLLYDLKGLFR
ncbi:MAG TPA: hypothetical protein IAA32_00375 [Candidatus Butyricicoccus stercorigallinarum]|nr:hypothetical protein [Candidatus Butyricicoccus stercorigallinarum]